jgi:hypothetical protein
MSGSDGTYSRTEVHVVRYTWVPVSMSHCARHSMLFSPEHLAPVALPGTEKPLGAILGARIRPDSGYVGDLQWADR